MKLSYRGVGYDYTPPTVETTQSEFVGKYRGLDWRFYAVKKAPVQQTNVELKYRGVAYQNHPGTTSALSVSEKARSRMMDRQRATTKRQQSMLLRLNAELGLVPVLG